MKNKKMLMLMLAGGICVAVKGQIQRQTGEITVARYPGAAVEVFDTPETVNPNDNYLYQDWTLGSIDLEHTQRVDIPQIPIRYNVVRDELEVKTDAMIKVVNLSLVREFSLWRPEYIEPVKFKRLLLGDRRGIFEVIAEGEHYSAYASYDHDVLAPDYNPQFDVGSKVPKTVIKEHYFILKESTGELTEIKLRKRALLKTFKNDRSVYKVVKESKVREKQDLRELLRTINKL